ncbi:hypothetical protein AX16_003456 [Volvariella volvacea WC 439]|nr:hypothetical protein AX16_003456 [Volvariella volvacea WC 439]
MSTYSYQILHPVDRDTRQPEAGDLDFVTISLTQSAGGRMQARGAAPNTVYWHWSSYGGKELEDGLGNEEGVDAQTWAFPFFAPSPEDEPATSRQVTLAHLRQANTMARLSLLLMIISGLYMITLTIALCTTITSPSPISFESNTDPNSDDSDAFWGHTRSRFGPILVPVLITFAIQLFAAYLASTATSRRMDPD